MAKVIMTASDGKILTDGHVYGKRISLGVDRDPSEFYEITQEQYEKILLEEEEDLTDREALEILMGGTYDTE